MTRSGGVIADMHSARNNAVCIMANVWRSALASCFARAFSVLPARGISLPSAYYRRCWRDTAAVFKRYRRGGARARLRGGAALTLAGGIEQITIDVNGVVMVS